MCVRDYKNSIWKSIFLRQHWREVYYRSEVDLTILHILNNCVFSRFCEYNQLHFINWKIEKFPRVHAASQWSNWALITGTFLIQFLNLSWNFVALNIILMLAPQYKYTIKLSLLLLSEIMLRKWESWGKWYIFFFY